MTRSWRARRAKVWVCVCVLVYFCVCQLNVFWYGACGWRSLEWAAKHCSNCYFCGMLNSCVQMRFKRLWCGCCCCAALLLLLQQASSLSLSLALFASPSHDVCVMSFYPPPYSMCFREWAFVSQLGIPAMDLPCDKPAWLQLPRSLALFHTLLFCIHLY